MVNKKIMGLLAMGGLFMAAANNKKIFSVPSQSRNNDIKPRKSLPRWEINGHSIFAKDEKTALKYATKRGLWKKAVKVE